jgi:hypothetical protein
MCLADHDRSHLMVMDDATTDEFARVRSEQRARSARGSYFWMVMVAYMIACPAVAIMVSRQISIDAATTATRQTELKLCAIIVTADDSYRAVPPISVTLKKQAANMARLRRDYHCPPNVGVSK